MGITEAQQRYPDFDWAAYDVARRKATENNPFGAKRHSRRLGQETPKREKLTMEEQATVNQGNALVRTAYKDVDEVRRAVVAAYGAGNNSLTPPQIQAVAYIAWSMGLDPSPGVGHIYAYFDGKGKFIITIGYQGYAFKAKQQRKVYFKPARPMTDTERQLHGVLGANAAAIVELYDYEDARMCHEMGIIYEPIIGIAVHTGKATPETKTPFWVASKNALKDACRKLGVGFGTYEIPAPNLVGGLVYNHETDEFRYPDEDGITEGEFADFIPTDDIVTRDASCKTWFPTDRQPHAPHELLHALQEHANNILAQQPAWEFPIGDGQDGAAKLERGLRPLGWDNKTRHAFTEIAFGVTSFKELPVAAGAALKDWALNIGTAKAELDAWMNQEKVAGAE